MSRQTVSVLALLSQKSSKLEKYVSSRDSSGKTPRAAHSKHSHLQCRKVSKKKMHLFSPNWASIWNHELPDKFANLKLQF